MTPGQAASSGIDSIPATLMVIIVALLSIAALKLIFVWIARALLDSGDGPSYGSFDWWFSSGGWSNGYGRWDADASAKSVERNLRKRS